MNDYRKLKKQPLNFVLAEFVFSTVMKIGDYVPELQERLRSVYPEFQLAESQNIEFKPNEQSVNVKTSMRWVFVNSDKSSMVSIAENKLVFMTTNYNRFSGFYAACQQAIEVLIENVKPSLVKRVGLRYGDLIEPTDDFMLEQLVEGYVSQPQSLIGLGDLIRHHTETLITTTAGTLAVRSLNGVHNLPCFPDMLGAPIPVGVQNGEATERVLLDFDHFWEAREPLEFSEENVLEKLEALHAVSREAFWEVTTKVAREEAWS